MPGKDVDGVDSRQISQAPSSQGGSGGIFGNASAAIGDVGVGTSAAESGDLFTNTSKTFDFAAPVINKGPSAVLVAIALIGVYFIARGKK